MRTMEEHTKIRQATPLARTGLGLALLAALLQLVLPRSAAVITRAIGPALLGILGCLWAIEWIVAGRRPAAPALALPAALFVASAGVGLWATYDAAEAWGTFSLLLGGIGLFWAVARAPSLAELRFLLACLAVLACGLTIAYLAGNPWEQYAVKVPALTAVGQRISSILPRAVGAALNPNWAGGMVAMLLPFCLALIGLTRQGSRPPGTGLRTRWLAGVLWSVCAMVAGGGLLFSVSRGAWGAVVIVGWLWAFWRWSSRLAWRRRLLLLGGMAAMSAVVVALIIAAIWVRELPGQEALAAHWMIQRSSLSLARDYFFTGAGLSGFMMQLSVYSLLLPVGYVSYSHSMLLDLLIGQGILALAAYVGAIGMGLVRAFKALRRLDPQRTLIVEAAVASQAIALIHGLVDNVLYLHHGTLLLWLPLGIMVSTALSAPLSLRDGAPQESIARPTRLGKVVIGIAAVAVLAAGWRPGVAALYANQGAVEQAKVELSAYNPSYDPSVEPWRSLDEIRSEENLYRATDWFHRALSLDPSQVTARQRLAGIALARGDYGEAQAHMAVVWAAGRRDATTRLLLGDASVAIGNTAEAAALIDGQPWAVPRLLDQAWSRYWEAGKWEQARGAWETVLLLEPHDRHAAYWAEEADRRLMTD